MDNLNEHMLQLLQSGEALEISAEMLDELSEDQRREFLELRQALQMLEQARPTGQSAIDSALFDVDPTPDAGTGIRDVSAFTPETIGSYDVLETIAHGGFGIVLKARDPRLDRIVALKIPRLESLLSSQDARERFAREARLVAMLGHPAIVPVYETGSDGPFLYIASAFCNGGTLSKWFRDRKTPVDPGQAARIVSRLAAAVQYAHSRGVIHRDLKPGNVLLHFDDDETRSSDEALIDGLRITDFGLARSTYCDQDLTQSGATIGTPAYMSPEQCRGEAGQIGVASDVYALGAMLYELLTGRPPHVRQSTLAMIRAIENETPVAVRQLNSAAPKDLESICRKCLEKDPQDRYQSAQQLEDDLQRFIAGQPVVARPIGRFSRLLRWSQHNPLIASSLAAAITALALGLAFSVGFGLQAHRALNVADAKSREALTQTRLARRAVDDLQRAIAGEPSLNSRGMQSFRQQILQSANDYYQLASVQRPHDKQVLQVYLQTLQSLARLHSELGDRSTAIAMLTEALDLQTSEFPEDRLSTAKLKLAIAGDLGRLRRHDEAVKRATSAVNELEVQATGNNTQEIRREWIEGLCILSELQIGRGNLSAASESADRAMAAAVELRSDQFDDWPADRLFARLLMLKSSLALSLINHADVEKYAPLAIDGFQRLNQQEPESLVSNLQSMATLHSHLSASHNVRRNFAQAIQYLAAERETLDELIGKQPEIASHHAQSANQLLRYAKSLYESGDVPATREVLNSHLPQIEKTLQQFPEENVMHTTIVLCYQLLARTFRRVDDMQTATAELAKAIRIAQRLCESDQSSAQECMILATLYLEQSTFFLQQKLYEDAARECQRGLIILENLYESEPAGEHVGQLEMAYNLCGNTMNKAGHFEEYLALSTPVVTWSADSPNIRKARAHRVVAMAGAGQWDDAETEFAQLAGGTTDPQETLNLTGLASKCAGTAADDEGEDADSHQFFLNQCRTMFDRLLTLEIIEDESVVRLLREHPDFAALRNTESYSRWAR